MGEERKQELAPWSWFLLCSATYSVVNFFSTFWKISVSCFKIARGERGFIAYEGSWSQVADRPSPAVFFQLLPALKMALLELWVPWICLSVYPVLMSSIVDTIAHTLQSWLALFFLLDLFWRVKPLITDCNFFSEKLHTTTFLPEQGCVYGGALDNGVVKSPELSAQTLHQLLEALRLCQCWDNSLGKQTNCYDNSSTILCDLAFAAVEDRFQKSSRKDMPEVTFMCNLEYSGFDPGSLEVKGCCVNPTASSPAKSENPCS